MNNALQHHIERSVIRSVVGNKSAAQQTSSFDPASFVDQTLTARTIGEMDYLCRIMGEHYGFDFFAIFVRIHRNKSAPLCFFMREFDDEWTQHYDKNRYMFTDPNIRLATTGVSPFFWSSTLFERVQDMLMPYEHAVCHDALEFGLRDIFNAPFQTINGDYGLIRFINRAGGRSAESDQCRQTENMSELYYLSSHIYEGLVRILSEDTPNVRLSDREKDILFWTASGLNPALVGDQLSISDNTVCKHLSNIRSKLGVRNTTHAVAKAISERMILF